MSEVIRAEDLRKIYRMGEIRVDALRGVDLSINDGDFIAIQGPSGSGKSTLLNLIGCLDRPSSGKVYIDDVDTSALSDNQLARIRREKIGFIFQTFNLIPTLSALENVALPMSFAGVKKSDRMERARDVLDVVELSHRANHKPSELSGGEQQRVAIARSLVNSPEIILADEPTGNIDTKAGNVIMDFLSSLNEKGKSLVVVTHDSMIAKRAHHVINIRDGCLTISS